MALATLAVRRAIDAPGRTDPHPGTGNHLATGPSPTARTARRRTGARLVGIAPATVAVPTGRATVRPTIAALHLVVTDRPTRSPEMDRSRVVVPSSARRVRMTGAAVTGLPAPEIGRTRTAPPAPAIGPTATVRRGVTNDRSGRPRIAQPPIGRATAARRATTVAPPATGRSGTTASRALTKGGPMTAVAPTDPATAARRSTVQAASGVGLIVLRVAMATVRSTIGAKGIGRPTVVRRRVTEAASDHPATENVRPTAVRPLVTDPIEASKGVIVRLVSGPVRDARRATSTVRTAIGRPMATDPNAEATAPATTVRRDGMPARRSTGGPRDPMTGRVPTALLGQRVSVRGRSGLHARVTVRPTDAAAKTGRPLSVTAAPRGMGTVRHTDGRLVMIARRTATTGTSRSPERAPGRRRSAPTSEAT